LEIENNFTVSQLGMFAHAYPNITGLIRGEHPEILARIGGTEKWLSAYKSSNISEMQQIALWLLLTRPIESPIRILLIGKFKSTTLDDLEGSLWILFHNTCVMLLLFIYLFLFSQFQSA